MSDLLQPWLVECPATVIVPFDQRVFFIHFFNCAKFAGWLAEITQTLDTISRRQFLTGGGRISQRWTPGTV